MEISWNKMGIGKSLKWIGAQLTIRSKHEVVISIPEEFAKELTEEVLEMLKLAWVEARRARRLAGKASWAGGIVPALGGILAPLWAAVTDAELDVQTSKTGDGEARVAITRIRPTLVWLLAFARRVRSQSEHCIFSDICKHRG